MRSSTSSPTTGPCTLPRLLALLLALVLVGSACSGSDDGSFSETSSDDRASSGAAAEAVEETTDGGGADEDAGDTATDSEIVEAAEGESGVSTGSGGAPAAVQSDPTADLGREIIRTASVTVEVDDVLVAGQEAMTIVEGVGGLLFDQTTSTTGTPSSTLTFRVQPADFSVALERLAGVGVVLAQEVSATDVTERVVDLQSRIITSEASVERLRAFLADATTLEAIAQIESELLQRETDLELLRGQLRTLENQVSLATITLHLTQVVPGPALDAEVTAYGGHDAGIACPGIDELEVTEGDAITLCVEIENTGDTHLGEFELTAGDVDLDDGDFTPIGDLDVVAPGQTISFWADAEAVRYRDGTVTVRARVVDTEGNDLRIATIDGQDSARLDVAEDLTPPSFVEGLSGGFGVLVTLAQVALFLLGVFLPFFWLPILAWFVWRWWKPRREARRAARFGRSAWQQPPPPAAPTPPAAPAPAAGDVNDV